MKKARIKRLLEIADFAREIVSPNWNISIGHQWRLKPGTLNVSLFDTIRDHCPRRSDLAYMNGPIRMEKCGDGWVGTCEIWIRTMVRTWDLFAVIMHELAHVATARYSIFLQRGELDSLPISCHRDDRMHGEIFQRAFERLILRAEKVHGCSWTTKTCRGDLQYMKAGFWV